MTGDEARARFEALLAELAARTGQEGLAAEPDGVCLLVFDGGTRLYLVADPNDASLVLWSPVAAVPEAGQAEFYRRLLIANLFWQGTGGATIGLEPGQDQAILALRRPLAGLDLAGLEAAIELMVEGVERLRRGLAELPPPEEAPPVFGAANPFIQA
jgi:hypothetical protein